MRDVFVSAYLGVVAVVAVWAALPPHAETTTPSAAASRVLLSANVLEVFVSVDRGTEHLVAALRYNAGQRVTPVLGALYPSLATLPSPGMGLKLDPEQLFIFQPDRVIAWPGRDTAVAATGYPGLLELPQENGSSMAYRLGLWHMFATLVGQTARAEALVARYQQSLAHLQARIAEMGAPAPRVVLLIGGARYGYWIAPPRYLLNEQLTAVGAELLRGPSMGGVVGLESLLALDPDVLFLESSGTGDGLQPADFYARPEWQVLRAVRAHRVYKMPVLPGMSIPVEAPVRMQWLAELLYPEQPASTRRALRETFYAVYGRWLSEDEVDGVLALDANRDAAGYARFHRGT